MGPPATAGGSDRRSPHLSAAPLRSMRTDSARPGPVKSTGALALALLVCLALVAGGQTQTAPPSGARGVVRLRVRVKIDDSPKRPLGLSRKRFFLIKGSLDDNKSLLQSIEQRLVVSRDCYYRAIGASEALITWLKQSDCESVYCREVESKDVDGPAAVPEFQ